MHDRTISLGFMKEKQQKISINSRWAQFAERLPLGEYRDVQGNSVRGNQGLQRCQAFSSHGQFVIDHTEPVQIDF